jgi:hypothetical protein
VQLSSGTDACVYRTQASIPNTKKNKDEDRHCPVFPTAQQILNLETLGLTGRCPRVIFNCPAEEEPGKYSQKTGRSVA